MKTASKQRVAVVGAGPAGCISAYFASKHSDVTVFDGSSPLRTLLYTGGGRCNLAYAEYDFTELVKFYPRGEKFLYSVFSQFSTADTLSFFEKIGVETYMQDDFRIFPESNSAKDVREKFLDALCNCKFNNQKVVSILEENNKFLIKTNSAKLYFDKVIVAVGGHAGYDLASALGHKIIEPKPALTGLITKESFKPIQGVSLKNISATVFVSGKNNLKLSGYSLNEDVIFTHEGISGPLAYKISSIFARVIYDKQNPLLLHLNFLQEQISENEFQGLLNSNSKKDLRNLICEFVPKSIADFLLKYVGLNQVLKCHEVDAKLRGLIFKSLSDFVVTVVSTAKEGEVVTSGGVDLDEVNPKTMQSKLVDGLFFCGEVLDIDGFCGGFNLQNCWSTGFIAGECVNKII